MATIRIRTGDKPGFTAWMIQVDKIIAAHTGGDNSDGIDDCNYRSMHAAGRTPHSAAMKALKMAGLGIFTT